MLKKMKVILLLVLFISCYPLFAEENKVTPGLEKNCINLAFVKNMGQADASVAYYANFAAGSLLVDHQGNITYSVTNPQKGTFQEIFSGSETCSISGLEKTSTQVNVFIGKDPRSWKKGIPVYQGLELDDIYSNITVQLLARGNSFEKVFIIRPGGDPDDIRASLRNIDGLSIDNNGRMEIKTATGEYYFSQPLAYQLINNQRKLVDVGYQIDKSGSGYSFVLGDYDKSRTLYIDPFFGSTYLGGSSSEVIHGTVVDSQGNIYVAGSTNSQNFPTPGEATQRGYYDVFVAKFDKNLEQLLAVTFWGGDAAEADIYFGLGIDSNDNIFVATHSKSSNVPMAGSSYDSSYNGGGSYFGDGVIAKFNSSLDSLLAATYLGGSGDDVFTDVKVMANGQVVVAGFSYSNNFPTVSGCVDTSHNGDSDMIVCVLSPNLDNLVSSTYLGGSNHDGARGIALDENNNIFIVGETWSTGMPTTGNAYDGSFNGGGEYGSDAYIAKFSPDLRNLLGGTYYGGSDDDWGHALTLGENEVFITGYTRSANLPVAGSGGDNSYNGSADLYIARFDSQLTNLLAASFIGGSGWEEPYKLLHDVEGNLYLTGTTGSNDYPVTNNVIDNSYNGGTFQYGGDVFVTSLDADLNITASTYIGGSGEDVANSMAFADGALVVAGRTTSTNYPVAENAYAKNHSGFDDGFVFKIDRQLSDKWQGTDLANISIELKAGKPEVGGTIFCLGVVKNMGQMDSAKSKAKLKVYLSGKKKLSGSSIFLGEKEIPAIKIGKSKKVKIKGIKVPANLKPKKYYLISVVASLDPNGDLDETNDQSISKSKIKFLK